MAQYTNASNSINYNSHVTLSGAANVTAVLDNYIIGIDDTAAPRTVTLPTASGTGDLANAGKIYIIKDQSGAAGTNNITIAPASGTIDGAANIVIDEDYGEASVYSDGTAWFSNMATGLSSPLTVPAGGTGLATITDGGILLGSGTGNINPTAQPTNGQLLIGSTGVDPALATLTAGAGMTVTNAAGSITLASGAVIWSVQATGTSLLANEGFISTAATAQNFPLPAASCPVGSILEITGNGAGLVTVTQNAGQSIRFGNSVSTVGVTGSVGSSEQGDAIKLVCTVSDTTFQAVTGSIGNWNVV